MIPDLEVYFICPKGAPPINENVEHIILDDDYLNKYSVRFNFPWNKLMGISDILKDIDFIIVNQPELVSNFRSLFETLDNKSIKIASYFHYVPIEKLPENGEIAYTSNMDHGNLAQIIFCRQLESLTIADYCITCSKYGIEFIRENAKLLSESYNNLIDEKMISIPPPFFLYDNAKEESSKQYKVKTFIYNHRLYDHYGTRTLFEWLTELYAQRKDFNILVTDPTGKRNEERNRLDKSVGYFHKWLCGLPFVKVEHIKHHRDYYNVLSRCYAGFAPLKPSALWSMSAVDVMTHGKPLIAPDYACFPEILDNNQFLLYKNKNDFLMKVRGILDNKDLYLNAANYCLKQAKSFTVEETAKIFKSLF